MAAKKLPAIQRQEGIVDDFLLPLARKGFRTVAKKQVKIGSKQFDKGSMKSIGKGLNNLTKSVKNTDKADALALKQGLIYKNKMAKGQGDRIAASTHTKGKRYDKIEKTTGKKVRTNRKKLNTLRDSEMFASNINSYKNLNNLVMSPIKPSNHAAQSKKLRKAVQKGK